MDDFETLNILICDDSITNALILTKLVEEEVNASVVTLTDPRKISPTLIEQSIDLMVLDLEMPYLNGFEIMQTVRKDYDQDQLPIIVITGLEGTKTRDKALTNGANDFLNKPFDPVEVTLRVKNLLKIRKNYLQREKDNANLEKQVEQRTQALRKSVEGLLYSLAVAGELKDNETGQHVLRVGKYARILANGYGLPIELVNMIEQAAPLHDIGKIGIPDNILLKPEKLDYDERKVMNKHTLFGYNLIGDNDSALIQMAQSIAYSHHERWDGKGYPSALKGESIPIEGRITAIADVFDALTTHRPYKQPWPIDQAVSYITEEAGQAFDPALIDVFQNNLASIKQVCIEFAD